MNQKKWIDKGKWRTILENVPIVSVDLFIFHNGGIVLGKRENEPAKGEWFVPGGLILKNEKPEAAIHRIASEEFDTEVEVRDFLETYEHIYETSELKGVDNKHYMVQAYVCISKSDDFVSDNQYEKIRIFYELPENLHQHVRD